MRMPPRIQALSFGVILKERRIFIGAEIEAWFFASTVHKACATAQKTGDRTDSRACIHCNMWCGISDT